MVFGHVQPASVPQTPPLMPGKLGSICYFIMISLSEIFVFFLHASGNRPAEDKTLVFK